MAIIKGINGTGEGTKTKPSPLSMPQISNKWSHEARHSAGSNRTDSEIVNAKCAV